MLPTFLNPRTFFKALEDIDNKSPHQYRDRTTSSEQAIVLLFSICVSLLLLEHTKNYSSMLSVLEQLSILQGYSQDYWHNKLINTGFHQLIGKFWWTAAHIVAYLLIPFAIIKFYLKQDIQDFGWKWADTGYHWRGYLYLLCPIIVLVFFAIQRQDFIDHYPYHENSRNSWFDLISWEVIYISQFICLEFFYRGFILNALRPHFGAAAIGVMIIPYLMIHFGKPWPEASGAIFFGLILGVLALQSRSIWGGVFVHTGVAVTTDISALLQQGLIPKQLWP